jgi:hypothetical protein
LTELDYPFHDCTAIVTTCGRNCYKKRKVNLSQVFAGQDVDVRQGDDHIWLVTFMHCDLGYFDDETCRLEPIGIPSLRKCYLCIRNKPSPMCPEWTRGEMEAPPLDYAWTTILVKRLCVASPCPDPTSTRSSGRAAASGRGDTRRGRHWWSLLPATRVSIT